jgi:hypothetical protein
MQLESCIAGGTANHIHSTHTTLFMLINRIIYVVPILGISFAKKPTHND